MLSFAKELQCLAEQAGYASAAQLAKAARLSTGMVDALYRHDRPCVSAVVVLKLAVALHVSADHFTPYLSSDEGPIPTIPPATPKGGTKVTKQSPQPPAKPTRGRPKKSEGKK